MSADIGRRVLALGFALFVCATLTCNETFAQALRTLPDQVVRSARPIDDSIEHLNDPSARFDLTEVTSLPLRSQFHRDGASEPSVRCRWYRFRLPRDLANAGPWILTTGADSATLFEPSRYGYHAESFGTQSPVAARRLRNGLANVDILPGDYARDLYVRTESGPSPALTFSTADAVAQNVDQQDFIEIFYVAVYSVLAVTACVFALMTRTRAFGYYGLYIGAQAIYTIEQLPLAPRSIWPNYVLPATLVDTAYALVSSIAYMQFLRDALETRSNRTLDRLVVAAGLLSAAFAGYAFFSDDMSPTHLVNHVLPFVLVAINTVDVGVVYIRWRQRFVSAGYYLIGFVGLLIGLLVDPFVPDINPPDIGFTFEAFAFLAALAFRLVTMTNERQRALVETVSAREATAAEYAKRIAAAELFNEAFSRFVPREFLKQLGRNDVREVVLGDHVEREMTVMFCDIRSFVSMSEDMTPEAMFNFLNVYFGKIGPIVRKHGGFIDKYLGDGVMALFSGPTDGALQAGVELHAEVRRLNEMRARNGERPVQIGVGLHRGATILATIGEQQRYDTTVVADVVNLASRLEGLTGVYGAQIIASEAVMSASVDRGAFNCRWLGEVIVQGSTAPLSTFEVCDGDAAELLLHKRNTAAAFSDALTAYRKSEYSTSRMRFDEVVQRNADDRVAAYFSERSRQRAALVDAGWDGIERQVNKR